MAKLPKTLFAKRVVDNETKYFETEYFEANEKKTELWDDMITWTEVGEYHLVKTSKIKGSVVEK